MDIKQVMKNYFVDLDRAAKSGERKVAWCTSVGPAEILRALGFEVFFPENHGAMLGATRMASETIPEANARGYSPDICSYLTADIGAYLKNVTPLTKAYGIDTIPKPDLLVYNTNQCKDVMHWFEYFAERYKVPIAGIHSPRYLPEVEAHHVADVVTQFRRVIEIGEKITGKKLEPERLSEVLSLSKRATDLWGEVLATAKSKPCPFTFFDGTVFMGPIVVLRGTSRAVAYYESLLAEMKAKAACGYEAVPKERTRIYWEGMPVWGRLRSLSDLFASNRASVCVSTYCNSWVFPDFSEADPLESMARSYLKIFINRDDSYKLDYIERLCGEFDVDGVVFHDAKTCPNNSNSRYNLPGRLRERGIKSVVIDGDLCDLRCFADEQAATMIEAFLETVSQ